MQAVIALPEIAESTRISEYQAGIFQKVASVPLLVRVIVTAARSGAGSFLILEPDELNRNYLRSYCNQAQLSSVWIRSIQFPGGFQPDNGKHWRQVADQLEERFLWLPWNWVTVKEELDPLLAAGTTTNTGVRLVQTEAPDSLLHSHKSITALPAVVVKMRLLGTAQVSIESHLSDPSVDVLSNRWRVGIPVTSRESKKEAEDFLLRRSGKPWDGVYSRFNRRLCRPFLREILKTPISPNLLTLASLPVALFSGYFFSLGTTAAFRMGGIFYYFSVLFDEADGMLARIKFQETPLGAWLEMAAHHLRYLFLFAGMTQGLAQYFNDSLWYYLGAAALLGSILSFLVLAGSPNRSEAVHSRLHQELASTSAGTFKKTIKKLAFLARKGTVAFYIMLFSLLGLVPALFILVVAGANLTWITGLLTRRQSTAFGV